MEGKKITKVLELGNSYAALMLDDEEVAVVKVVTPDFPLDELVDFVGAKTETTAKEEKKEEKKAEPEPEGEDYTFADLQEMNRKKLTKFCDENNLATDPDDFEKDEDEEFREAIAKECDIEIPEKAEPETGNDKKNDPGKADDDYTWKDLKKMDFDELKELCDENDMNTDPGDFDEDEEDDFRRAIAKEAGIEAPKKKKK